ncbi:hypothetical protein HYV86_00105 [Candidatus Woesearchaeota archaeon]|nr:hypothetical protein [Candidatus Woesearchaeota archaeon]
MIGYILGLAFLPVSVILFLNAFGFLGLSELFGMPLLLLGALGVIIVMIGDVIDAHTQQSHRIRTTIVCLLIMLPAFVYFLSFLITFPAVITSSLPVIIASFLFVEGVSSLLIGAE